MLYNLNIAITLTAGIIAGISALAGLILGPTVAKGFDKMGKSVEKNIKGSIYKSITPEEKTEDTGKVKSEQKPIEEPKKQPQEIIDNAQSNQEKATENISNPAQELENEAPQPSPITPTPTPTENQTPQIKDATNEGIETSVNGIDYKSIFEWQEEQQRKAWEREDQIRKETQEREDTAYQRAIEDMKKAGINPNLLSSINPAESGGGITNATQMNMQLYQGELEKYLGILETEINNSFKEDENTKDRVTDAVKNVVSLFAMYFMMKR